MDLRSWIIRIIPGDLVANETRISQIVGRVALCAFNFINLGVPHFTIQSYKKAQEMVKEILNRSSSASSLLLSCFLYNNARVQVHRPLHPIRWCWSRHVSCSWSVVCSEPNLPCLVARFKIAGSTSMLAWVSGLSYHSRRSNVLVTLLRSHIDAL